MKNDLMRILLMVFLLFFSAAPESAVGQTKAGTKGLTQFILTVRGTKPTAIALNRELFMLPVEEFTT
jgi:hypothetical protein